MTPQKLSLEERANKAAFNETGMLRTVIPFKEEDDPAWRFKRELAMCKASYLEGARQELQALKIKMYELRRTEHPIDCCAEFLDIEDVMELIDESLK